MKFEDITQAIRVLRYIGLESITISKPEKLRSLMLSDKNCMFFQPNMPEIAYTFEDKLTRLKIYGVNIIIKGDRYGIH